MGAPRHAHAPTHRGEGTAGSAASTPALHWLLLNMYHNRPTGVQRHSRDVENLLYRASTSRCAFVPETKARSSELLRATAEYHARHLGVGGSWNARSNTKMKREGDSSHPCRTHCRWGKRPLIIHCRATPDKEPCRSTIACSNGDPHLFNAEVTKAKRRLLSDRRLRADSA